MIYGEQISDYCTSGNKKNRSLRLIMKKIMNFIENFDMTDRGV